MEQHRCYGCMQLHDGEFCPSCGWPNNKNNEPHQLPVGTVLRGQYEVGRVLGQGGFGITYLGWDRHLETAVCIKEYFPNHAVSRDCSVSTQVHCHTQAGAEVYRASKERFLREGKILAQFRDIPEIVSIYGFFEENDTVYIVMEYIKGMDLAHYIRHRGGRLTSEETFRILKPVMEALAQVHRGELVHRDIAPDNIMLHPRGGAKLLDFGAARMVENAGVDKGLDRSTEAIVKHGFAPMEQYQTRGNLGPWTDVYAMCATVYYCLTGQIPPEATTRMMGEAWFSWAGIPGLTDRQRQALEKGMAVLPRDRYASMEELLDGLFGDAPMASRPPVQSAPAAQPPVQGVPASGYNVPSSGYNVPPSGYNAPASPFNAPSYNVPAPGYNAPPVQKKKSGKGLVIGLVAVIAAVIIGVGGFLVANLLSDTVDDSRVSSREEPAEAPAMTEAPAVEAPAAETEPATEAPAVAEEYYEFGMILCDSSLEELPDQLISYMEEQGVGFSLTYCQLDDTSEMVSCMAEFAAAGMDAIILQSAGYSDEALMEGADMCAAWGIPVILVGNDGSYERGVWDLVDKGTDVHYAGQDPRYIADYMVVTMFSRMTPEENSCIDYLLLGGENMEWENEGINQRIPGAMDELGYAYNRLSPGYSGDEGLAILNELVFAGQDIDVIFCTDPEYAEKAAIICMECGLDLGGETVIISLGEDSELASLYEAYMISGGICYSRDLLVTQVAQTLVLAVRREPLDPYCRLPMIVW